MSCFSCFRRANLHLMSCFSCCKRANRQIMSCFSCFRGANLKNKHIFVNLPVLFYCWQINQRVPNGITECQPEYYGIGGGAVSVTIEIIPEFQNHHWTPAEIEASHHAENGFDRSFVRRKIFHPCCSSSAFYSSHLLDLLVNNMVQDGCTSEDDTGR